MFNNYEEFLNEGGNFLKEITPSERKSLDLLGKDLETDEIPKMIQKFGFEQVPVKKGSSSADHAFYDPVSKLRYTSNDSGYVRYYDPTATLWRTGEPVTTKTPISKYKLDLRDRLLVILRRVMKIKGFYGSWMKSKLTVKDFVVDHRGELLGKKFNV
jgi:hypothetical protein